MASACGTGLGVAAAFMPRRWPTTHVGMNAPSWLPHTSAFVRAGSTVSSPYELCAILSLFRRQRLGNLLRHAMDDAFGIGCAQAEDDMGRARGDIWADHVAAGGQIVWRYQHLDRPLDGRRV